MAKKIKKLKKEIKSDLHNQFSRISRNVIYDSSRPLSDEEIRILTLFSFIVVFFQILGAVLNIYNWAFGTGDINFDSYHPLAPVVGIVAYMLYTTCLWYKGVRYWLAYVPAIVAFGYNALLYAMMHSYITLEMLRDFLLKFPLIH